MKQDPFIVPAQGWSTANRRSQESFGLSLPLAVFLLWPDNRSWMGKVRCLKHSTRRKSEARAGGRASPAGLPPRFAHFFWNRLSCICLICLGVLLPPVASVPGG